MDKIIEEDFTNELIKLFYRCKAFVRLERAKELYKLKKLRKGKFHKKRNKNIKIIYPVTYRCVMDESDLD